MYDDKNVDGNQSTGINRRDLPIDGEVSFLFADLHTLPRPVLRQSGSNSQPKPPLPLGSSRGPMEPESGPLSLKVARLVMGPMIGYPWVDKRYGAESSNVRSSHVWTYLMREQINVSQIPEVVRGMYVRCMYGVRPVHLSGGG